MNDTDISNNQGSVIVEARLCKYSCGFPEDIVTFFNDNIATWLDPWTVEVQTNGHEMEGTNQRIGLTAFVEEPCHVRIAAIEEIGGTFNCVSGGWYNLTGVHGGHDCEGVEHLLKGAVGYQFVAVTKDTLNSPDCGTNQRANFTLRITFQNTDPQ